MIKKAIIPAGGLGTRFLPATKAIPKEMLPIVDKPTIQYIVEEVVESGVEDLLIISGRGKRAIEDHFDKSYELEEELSRKNDEKLLSLIKKASNLINVHYVRQKQAKGLGHAIYCGRAFAGNEPFAVLLGDDVVDAKKPCLKQLVEVYNEYNASILGVQEVKEDDVDKYGIISGQNIKDRLYSVNDLVEKPEKQKAPSNIAILGRYIITPKIFDALSSVPPGKNGEIQLTDAFKKLLEQERVYAYNFEGRRFDVGDKLGFLEASVEFALKREDLKEGFAKFLKSLNI